LPFLNAFLAPNPIPAAISIVKPPSIGQAGSNGSQFGSGGEAIVFNGSMQTKNIKTRNKFSSFLLLILLSLLDTKIIPFTN